MGVDSARGLYICALWALVLYMVIYSAFVLSVQYGRFWGHCARALRFCRVALPLGMRSRFKIWLVLRFVVFAGVLVWARCFRALVCRFLSL